MAYSLLCIDDGNGGIKIAFTFIIIDISQILLQGRLNTTNTIYIDTAIFKE